MKDTMPYQRHLSNWGCDVIGRHTCLRSTVLWVRVPPSPPKKGRPVVVNNKIVITSEEEEPIELKVNTNVYKALKNLIHNDLGMSKEDITNLIAEVVRDEVHARIVDATFLETYIRKQVHEMICGVIKAPAWSTESRVREAMHKAVNELVLEEVRKQVKEFQVTVKTVNT